MQQALAYAEALDVPFVLSSNGDAFVFHDRTGHTHPVENTLSLREFPSPGQLWSRYRTWKGLSDDAEKLARIPYHDDGSGKEPRYYQRIATQRTIEAIADGERRVLLAMATGTGKTYTAFQIIRRLWKAGTVKRVLFLADRNILIDQTITNDFKPFGSVMTGEAVLDALLNKYADEGLVPVEDLSVLRVQPFSDLGTPIELIRACGGRDGYLAVVRELERALYTTAAQRHLGETIVMALSSTIKANQDIMRKDVGVDGDAQRIGQLIWLLFLKIWDDREQELELLENSFVSPLVGVRWTDAAGETHEASDLR